ncbi:hypothetical protein VTJ04DRAFT_9614 [Mycothermus thermophilus]|uniref:uncharacterized protein n=1 Tax=Humicola insolens TaxID=85995 RepID=UPI003744501C
MPLPFPFNPSLIPTIRTRKALLILDLQNDFVSPEGPLYAEEPEGYIGRILDVVKAFREANAGDVIWVRSEFDRHVSLIEDDEQIIVGDALPRSQRPTPSRGRKPVSLLHDGAAMEDDEEAFLSVSSRQPKPECARKGTKGAEFAPDVKAAVAQRDIIYTKTHYSAFAPGQQPQLVQLLRGRFVTEMYICGALTNISIYATALGAGQHGYDVTVVDDCCGFRNAVRHLNAMRQLVDLTGCGMISAETLIEELKQASSSAQAKEQQQQQSRSTGLSPQISKMALASTTSSSPPAPSSSASPASGPRPSSHSSPRTPPKPAPPQPGRSDSPKHQFPSNQNEGSSRSSGDPMRQSHDAGPNNAESDGPSPHAASNESTHSPETKPEEVQRKDQSAKKAPEDAGELEEDTKKGPTLSSSELPLRIKKTEEPRGVAESVGDRDDKASSRRDKTSPSARDVVATTSCTTQREPEQSREQQATGTDTVEPNSSTSTTTMTADPEQPQTQEEHKAVVGEPLAEGDTMVITNVLPPDLAADAFERLLDEVSWGTMTHLGGEVPRRIAVQGEVAEDGSMPVYRHPADESPPLLPFSPTVRRIKEVVEKHLGHELNHVLIQHYRTGNDYISEHSDKTLDIAPNTYIANVSLGAERTMVFRTKRPPKDKEKDKDKNDHSSDHDDSAAPTNSSKSPSGGAKRSIQRAPLPHNSLMKMGLRTNAAWTHAIRQDKRADRDKTPSELAYDGARISLTFRLIHTFIDASQTYIWGQGATSKTRDGAKRVINGQTEEAVKLLQAFGKENNTGAEFSWEQTYGAGSDVLHMGTPKRLFTAAIVEDADPKSRREAEIANLRAVLALAELGIGYAKGSIAGGDVRFEDNNDLVDASEGPDGKRMVIVEGAANLLRYLDAVYGAGRRYDQLPPGEVARRFVRVQRALDLFGVWERALEEVGLTNTNTTTGGGVTDEQKKTLQKLLAKELAEFESWAREAESAVTSTTTSGSATNTVFYIANTPQASPADFALWPVLYDMARVCGEGWLAATTAAATGEGEGKEVGGSLVRFFAAFCNRSSVGKALGVVGEGVKTEKKE